LIDRNYSATHLLRLKRNAAEGRSLGKPGRLDDVDALLMQGRKIGANDAKGLEMPKASKAARPRLA